MPIVTFEPSGKTVLVPSGTLLFDAACRVGLPVASSCSSEAVCGKCVMTLLKGNEALSLETPAETRLLNRDSREKNERISCLVKILSDCTVTTTYW